MSLVVCFLEYSVVLLTLLQRFSRQSIGIAIAIGLLFITPPTGAVAKTVMSMFVCVPICLSARISPEPHARSLLITIFCACCLCPWLGPAPAC